MLSLEISAFENRDQDEWALLEAHLPGRAPQRIGILLREAKHDNLYVRTRPDWWLGLLDEEQSLFWSELAGDLRERARELGAAKVLDWLEDTASHTLRMSARQPIQVTNVKATLNRLDEQYLGAAEARTELACATQVHGLVCPPQRGPLLLLPKQPRPIRMDHCWAQGALAATLVLAATLAGIHKNHSATLITKQETVVQREIALPLFPASGYQTVLLNLEASWQQQPHARRHRNKRRHQVPSGARKQFNPQLVLAQHRPVRLAALEAPNTELMSEVAMAPLSWIPTPDPPDFRP